MDWGPRVPQSSSRLASPALDRAKRRGRPIPPVFQAPSRQRPLHRRHFPASEPCCLCSSRLGCPSRSLACQILPVLQGPPQMPLPLGSRSGCPSGTRGSPGGSVEKHLPAMQEPHTWVRSLGWEDPLEEGTAAHPSARAWRVPRTEEPGGLQSVGSQSWARLKRLSTHTPGASLSPPSPRTPPCVCDSPGHLEHICVPLIPGLVAWGQPPLGWHTAGFRQSGLRHPGPLIPTLSPGRDVLPSGSR